jgi:hypothetical protein
MDHLVTRDSLGTQPGRHADGAAAGQIDSLRRNRENGFVLSHPDPRVPFGPAVPMRYGDPIGSSRIAPQTSSDGPAESRCNRVQRHGQGALVHDTIA